MVKLAVAVLTLGGIFMADPAMASDGYENRAALLFAYRISDAPKFDAAYREHLGWHRDHQDHLTWYGWYVIAGARTGMFVDGTFGGDFAAIDRRPDPAGDAQHFLSGAALHSTAVVYNAWTLWPGPSTDFSLEDQKPTAMIDALLVTPRSGEARAFERALLGAARNRGNGRFRWTWYRAAAGAMLPSYLVLIPRDNWAMLAGRPATIGGLAAAAFRMNAADIERLDALVANVEAETWRYRPDLSLMGPKD